VGGHQQADDRLEVLVALPDRGRSAARARRPVEDTRMSSLVVDVSIWVTV
jgi:hypothetical protein